MNKGQHFLFSVLFVFVIGVLTTNCDGFRRRDKSGIESFFKNQSKTLDELERKNKAMLSMFMKEMIPIALKISHEARLSIPCSEALHYTIRGARHLSDWAISLLDASGRSPAGLFDGTATDFGDFDECLDVTATKERLSSGRIRGINFHGKYCLVETALPELLKLTPKSKGRGENGSVVMQLEQSKTIFNRLLRLRDSGRYFAGRLGLCVPSVCTEDDVTRGMQMFGDPFELSISVISCTDRQSLPWKLHQVVLGCFFGLLSVLCVIGTIVDVTWRLNYKQPFKRSIFEKSRGVFMGFSLYSNTIKLISIKTRDSGVSLDVLCGLRFFSIMWIILAHTYFFPVVPFFFRLRRLLSYNDFREQFLFGAVNNASVSVDTFFFISGFLVTYIMGKRVVSSIGPMSLLRFVLRRLIRLLPATMITIAIFMMLPLWGDGPQWKEFVVDNVEVCEKTWWRNLLFIQNFWDIKNNCLFHTWFLAVTMQFCIISVALLYLLFKKPELGVSVILFTIVLSSGITAMVNVRNNFPPAVALTVLDSSTWDELLSKIYIRPSTHMGPYCIGLLVGYFLSKKEKILFTKLQQTVAWVCTFFCMAVCIYGLYEFNHEGENYVIFSALYAATNRSLWALAIAWITVACLTGYGGVINRFLSWKIFVPLDKLVYFAYLLHPIVMFYYHGQARERLYFGHFEMVIHYLGFAALSFAFAYICHITIELPIAILDSTLFPKRNYIVKETVVTTKITNLLTDHVGDVTEDKSCQVSVIKPAISVSVQ